MNRISFGSVEDRMDLPMMIENPVASYNRFLSEGIDEVFKEIFPIEDHNNTYVLHYVSVSVGKPEMTPEEALRTNSGYSLPLKGTFQLENKALSGSIIESEVYLGELPCMTEDGSFITRGHDRVVVSQIARSSGVFFSKETTKKGLDKYTADIIPSSGDWLKVIIDNKEQMFVMVNNKTKIPIAMFLEAFGIGKDWDERRKIFNHHPFIDASLELMEKEGVENKEEAVIEVYKKLRPNEMPTYERARDYIQSMFTDEKKYNLAKVGRHKMNKKLRVNERVIKKTLSRDIGPYKAGEILTDEMVDDLDVNEIYVENHQGKEVKVISNKEPESKQLTKEDFISIMNYYVCLNEGIGFVDDIDHLSNRRLRLVGELVQENFYKGLKRVEKLVKERMNKQTDEEKSPNMLIHIRPLVSAIKEFLGTSRLSQFTDQVNPLAELSNKRRNSALGEGGMSKERVSMEARDVHYSHFGKICPSETPEGDSVGLINTLASYSKVDEFGFLQTPYSKVDKKEKKITDSVEYLAADDEERYYICESRNIDKDGKFISDRVTVRYGKQYLIVPVEEVDFVDVSTKQLIGIAANLIPFIEHDDANRTNMGANMQRQALPLLRPEEPVVGTGMEEMIAKESKSSYVAEEDGIVSAFGGGELVVSYDNIGNKKYKIKKYKRTNDGTAFNHRVRVSVGERVRKGQVMVDSSSSNNGEVALGQNAVVAFMTWKGYNFEDAIIINERLVKDDVYTSVDIEEYTVDVLETRGGKELVTKDIPDTGDRQKRELDEEGIVRVGAQVKPGDILVGKKVPKTQDDSTQEEQFLAHVFNQRNKDYKDESMRLPHGREGFVYNVERLSKEEADLPNGSYEQVKVQIAEKRKIRVGDKMAGRHGNKGVIAVIVPEEDMPHLEDGRSVDVILSPLGVPSRMNIGQLMETHLGIAAKVLGVKFETPVFDGASKEEISEQLTKAGLPGDGKSYLIDGETGEHFENPVTVGVMYMLKLDHQVLEKIHARATGKYSLVTQQPLGGKSQNGGQRFGEMEVWAMEAYGAAYNLQEMLTLKSDDVQGRNRMYGALVDGTDIPEPGIPESTKVMIRELRSLGFDIDILADDGESYIDRTPK